MSRQLIGTDRPCVKNQAIISVSPDPVVSKHLAPCRSDDGGSSELTSVRFRSSKIG